MKTPLVFSLNLGTEQFRIIKNIKQTYYHLHEGPDLKQSLSGFNKALLFREEAGVEVYGQGRFIPGPAETLVSQKP